MAGPTTALMHALSVHRITVYLLLCAHVRLMVSAGGLCCCDWSMDCRHTLGKHSQALPQHNLLPW